MFYDYSMKNILVIFHILSQLNYPSYKPAITDYSSKSILLTVTSILNKAPIYLMHNVPLTSISWYIETKNIFFLYISLSLYFSPYFPHILSLIFAAQVSMRFALFMKFGALTATYVTSTCSKRRYEFISANVH